jgi:hypothetical protein
MDTVDRDRDLPPVYVGESWLIHYWPWCMVTVALVPLALGNLGAVLFFVVPALLFATILPWRFAVFGRGIMLWFGFGKQRFVAKENITIRAGLGGVLVLPRGADRFGYPLTDGFVERDRTVLRSVLAEHGFDVSD